MRVCPCRWSWNPLIKQQSVAPTWPVEQGEVRRVRVRDGHVESQLRTFLRSIYKTSRSDVADHIVWWELIDDMNEKGNMKNEKSCPRRYGVGSCIQASVERRRILGATQYPLVLITTGHANHPYPIRRQFHVLERMPRWKKMHLQGHVPDPKDDLEYEVTDVSSLLVETRWPRQGSGSVE